MEHSHHHFERRSSFFLVNVNRYSASVVSHCDGVIFVDRYCYIVAITGEGFIDGVIHHFVNQVMESFYTYIAYVHGGAFSYCFQSLEYLNTAGSVLFSSFVNLFFCHFLSL